MSTQLLEKHRRQTVPKPDSSKAASSATLFLEHDDPAPLLDFYNVFYSSLLPYKRQFVVSDFRRTIDDFASVIAEVNERFGRRFALYEGTSEQQDRVDAAIRREHQQHMDANPATLPLPSADKQRRKVPIIERIHAAENRSRLQFAHELYEAYTTG
jgi:hypothetical protein